MDTKERAAELVERVRKASQGRVGLLKSTASVLLHAVAGEEVLVVAVDGAKFEFEGYHRARGHIALVTARFVAFVELKGAVTGGPFAENDEPTIIEVFPRAAVESVTLECPTIWRTGQGGEFDFEQVPWGTEVRARYRDHAEPLIIRDEISDVPVTEVHRMLLEDLAAAR